MFVPVPTIGDQGKPVQEYVVEIHGLTKQFPGVRALDAASLAIRPGEVHGLVGENGAGKSTLIRILAGAEHRDDGLIRVDGADVTLTDERDADALGLHFIHQDVALVARLSVTENLFLGRRLPSVGPFVSQRRAAAEARTMLAGFADIDPERTVGSLTVAERWMVGIARACAGDARLVVMDEPTVALADAEVERVFTAVRRLRDSGIAVLFVSHRLGEIMHIADRVTVMKDGRTVGHHDIGDLDRTRLVAHIIGREAGALVEPMQPAAPHADVVLEATGLCSGAMRDVDLRLRAGEILGLGGLVGSGRSSLLLTLFGHRRPSHGKIAVAGREVNFRSPADAIKAGLALLPEDRRGQGLFAKRSLRENIVIAHLRDFRRSARLPSPNRRLEVQRATEEISRLHIATSGPEQRIATLSGGNQQKSLLSRWLIGRETKVLLLDEPTKGVDVGAKSGILQLVTELAEQGVGVIIASSDLEEVAAVSHRVIVLREGAVVAELHGPVTEAEILSHCYEEAAATAAGGR